MIDEELKNRFLIEIARWVTTCSVTGVMIRNSKMEELANDIVVADEIERKRI